MSNRVYDQTYYDILGVEPTASQEEITKAYKRLAMQYHPDRNKDEADGVLFQAITGAYETLNDTDKRAEYDAYIADSKNNVHRAIADGITRLLNAVVPNPMNPREMRYAVDPAKNDIIVVFRKTVTMQQRSLLKDYRDKVKMAKRFEKAIPRVRSKLTVASNALRMQRKNYLLAAREMLHCWIFGQKVVAALDDYNWTVDGMEPDAPGGRRMLGSTKLLGSSTNPLSFLDDEFPA